MQREIIEIIEDLCNGCELCIPNCPEGAIQVIDGKARLISDLFCDGLGACVGHCPEGAMKIELRDAEPYDERKAMENIIRQGAKVIHAHLSHLKEHGQHELLAEAVAFLEEKGLDSRELLLGAGCSSKGENSACPGARALELTPTETAEPGRVPSCLSQWPIQLHLISPEAPYFRQKDLLLAADCVAYALGDFHHRFLKGSSLAIACPKLDAGQEVYEQKLQSLIDHAEIKSLSVMIMQVPCCMGLFQLAQRSALGASRKISVKLVVVGLNGDILAEKSWHP